MEAKDTVMSNRDLLRFEIRYTREDSFYWGAAFDAALREQAEISFKAGIEEGYIRQSKPSEDRVGVKEMEQIYADKPEPIPMCLHYDPLVPNGCWMRRYGNLKCHSERKGCPDYKPSYAPAQSG